MLAPAAESAGQTPAGIAEAGGATVLFQFNRSSNPAPLLWKGPLFSFWLPSTSQADLRVESYHFVPNRGKLQGLVDITNAPDGVSIGRGMIQLSQAAVGDWTVDLSAGDRPLGVYSLDFRIGSLFNPFAGLRGGQMAASKGGTTISIFGGRTTATGGLFGGTELVSDQRLYGARAVLNPKTRLKVAASLVRTAATPSTDGVPLPRSTTALTADAIFSVTNSVRLLGEASIAQYAGSVDTPRPDGHEVSFLAGGRVGGEGRGLEVSAVRLGPNYMPLGNFRLGDRAGVYAFGNYPLAEALQVSGGVSRYRDNVSRASTRPTFTVDNAFLNGRYRLAPNTHLGLRVGQGGVESDSTVNVLSSRNRDVRLDVTQQFGTWRLMARGNQIRTSDTTSTAEHAVRRRVDVETRRTWRNGTSLFVTLGMLREAIRETGQKRSSFVGDAGWSGAIRSVSVYGEASWNQESSVLRTSSVHNVAFTAGASWTMPRGLRLVASGRYSRDSTTLSAFDAVAVTPDSLGDLQAFLLNRRSHTSQFNVRVTKDLRWGRRPLAAGAPGAAVRPVEVGVVAGSVFNDLNRDGIRDPEEAGVPHATVILDGQARQEVDATGAFLFKNVPVGTRTVELELSTVPASFDIGPRSKVTLEVAKRATAEANFPLIQLGRMQGRIVVVDRNAVDMRWQDGAGAQPREKTGSNLIVILNDRFKVTMSDADGEFEFRGIPAGEYTVRLDPSSLPEYWEVASKPELAVTLSPGGRVENLEFVVAVVPRPARRVIIAGPPSHEEQRKRDPR
jgi:hypothetical protein